MDFDGYILAVQFRKLECGYKEPVLLSDINVLRTQAVCALAVRHCTGHANISAHNVLHVKLYWWDIPY